MVTKIIKRDGRKDAYQEQKVAHAMLKAANVVTGGKIDTELTSKIYDLAKEVTELVDKGFGKKTPPTVEQVQDIVEKVLIEAELVGVAKEYILYRAERTKQREMNAELMKIYEGLTFKDSKDNDLKRENANVDADAPMGTMLKYGAEGAKKFNTLHLLEPEVVKAHTSGDIHIHDFDFYALTETCDQIDLKKLFKGGFSTGHGFIREPKDIRSYASLACIAIQSNQNDMHGGQSIAKFDYDMAKGVALTYIKELLKATSVLWDKEESELEFVKSEFKAYMNGRDHILDSEGKAKVHELLSSLGIDEVGISHIERVALKYTEEATHQAMEAVIHNLNSMHCLPYTEKIWVYDKVYNDLKLIQIGKLNEIFEKGRYFAISLNQKTGKAELKEINAICKKDNQRRLVTLTTVKGQKVTVTDNHKVMTLDGLTITDSYPEDTKVMLSPRGIKLPQVNNDICLTEYGSVRKDSRYLDEHLVVTEELAELFGMYVADGSICSGESTLCLTTCDKFSKDYLDSLVQDVFGVTFTDMVTSYADKEGNTKAKDFRYNVGVRIGRMLKDLCGSTSRTKKIPKHIMFGSEEVKISFLKGYLSCDGRKGANIHEASTVSELLQKQLNLLVMSMKEQVSLSKRLEVGGFSSNVETPIYGVLLGNKASKRLGVPKEYDANVEIPKYDLSFVRNYLTKEQLASLPRRHSDAVRYSELEMLIDVYETVELKHLENMFVLPVKETEVSNSGDVYVYDISVKDNENFLTADGLYVHNSRAGAQVPFSSLNLGTDTSEEGRMVIRHLLLATEEGMGNGETPIFPISIFKVKEGINYNPGDPNYDLFKLACRVSAKRLFPNFSFIDAPFNLPYYKEGRPETEIAYMGCRTRVISNVYDPSNEVVTGRGNLSFTSINLPRLGIEAHGDIDKFYRDLDNLMKLVHGQLLSRFKIQASKKVRNYPFLMGQGNWLGSENLSIDDTVGEVLKQGTLSIGFIGLAETLKALTGKHHGESEDSQKLGLEIIGHMRALTDKWSAKEKLNYSLLATPAEGLSGRFVRIDKKKYGEIKGVTDKDWYTNSSHCPVEYPISVVKKLQLEAPYHALENAGHIAYVELDGDPSKNLDAFEAVVRCMKESGVGYGAINHPVDRDPVCGYVGIIDDVCPRCGRRAGEQLSPERISELRKMYMDLPATLS